MSPPNVLLIILDSVRARNTSLHDYPRPTTPFLQDFGSVATVYHQARSPSIHSVSSHASIFTGLHVEEHGVTDHASSLDPTATIWHELASEHDYETGMFSPNVIVTVTSNLSEPFHHLDGPRRDDRDRYFEDALSPTDIEGRLERTEYLRECFQSEKPVRAAANGLFFLYNDRGEYDPTEEGGFEYVDSFLDWSADVDGPWASCLNLMDAHYPYVPAAEYDRWGGEELQALHDELPAPPSREIAATGNWWKLRAIESLYDGCISQADAVMEYLVEQLRERNELEDTLLVITSDHGEGFGEHSQLNSDVQMADHGWGIDEVLTHVPLIVHHPSRSDPGDEAGLASLTRFPTVVREEVGGDAGSFAVGDDGALASTYRLEAPEEVLPSACPNRSSYAGPWRAVYSDDENGVCKHAVNGERSVSIRIHSARESQQLGEGDVSLVEERFAALHDAGVNTSERDGRSLDAEVETQLEELGYLR